MDFTFAITSANPVGNEYLREVIDSILLYGGPNPEILVIGGMEDFAYRGCRHIKFDDSVKAGWITRKKNILTAEAANGDVVYLHDYVALMPGWYDGWESWGHEYSVCMNPIENHNGERFRDWVLHPGFCSHLLTQQDEGMMLPYDVTAKNISRLMYISGSYWVAKKSVMLEFPLDEGRAWAESEDIEWSQRVATAHVFSMNPLSPVKILKPGKLRAFHECSGEFLNKIKGIEYATV